ncbi:MULTISPECIES: hypothetical protein [Streptomyces]|uniref:Serine/threonine protein kinase n=1 Tax=Streptomyces edwardsiae TaxID=3075527 RepID=A0ABU2QL13_9ACTN|nr:MULTISPECIES: hypothetical protein [unclassified Streptomyces]MDT0404165.1 hypothetical protein [Streptomyces sp. DSM 41635]
MTSRAWVGHSRVSPPAPRGGRFRRTRVATAAVGLTGALALTACGGGGSDDSDTKPTPAPSATAAPSPDVSRAPAGPLEGSWLVTVDSQAVVLMVSGEEAALFATGGTVCSGTAREEGGTRTIRLKCGDDEDRANGTVVSVDKDSLKVTWKSPLGTETYTRAEGGSFPSGLPTEGVGP